MGFDTLFVVDVQPVYTVNTVYVAKVAAEVQSARIAGKSIVFLWVPYRSPMDEVGYKPTYPEVVKEVRGYASWAEVEKLRASGAREALNECEHCGFSTKRIRLIGGHSSLCLYETVVDLLKRTTDTIVEVDCGNCYPVDENPWGEYPIHPRLHLIV